MPFVRTLSILDDVKTRLAALTLGQVFNTDGQPMDDASNDPTLLFNDVKVYARRDIVAAMQELYLFDDRLAILVPGGFDHTAKLHGTSLRMRRRMEFVLILTDRNFGGENTALVGEAGENPGVLLMAELVVAVLAGQTLGRAADWVALQPGHGEVLRITDKQREDAPGRDAWVQEFSTEAGEMQTATGRLHLEGEGR
jgi:hypothetical protein